MNKNRKGSGAIIGIIVVIIIVIGVAFWMRSTSKNMPAPKSTSDSSVQTPETLSNQNQANNPEIPNTSDTENNTNTPAAQTAQITIKNFSFGPNTSTINAGTKVVWTNQDSTAHTVVGDNFSSGQVQPGGTFQFTFSTPGTFNYHCSIHPTMTGKVIVQ